MHQTRVPGDDDHEPVPVILHPLQEGLDRFLAEVDTPLARPREGVGLVDEKDAVECPSDDTFGLQRGHAHVFTDEAGTVDLDKVAFSEQPHRPVHVGEQSGDRGLAGTGVSEENEVLGGRHLREAALETLPLDLEKRDQRAHLVFDGLQTDQRV